MSVLTAEELHVGIARMDSVFFILLPHKQQWHFNSVTMDSLSPTSVGEDDD